VLAQQGKLSLCQFNSNLSSLARLFLNRAGVCCQAADLSFTEIHVDALAGDVMAGAGGAAGPAYVTNLQVKQLLYTGTIDSLTTTLAVQWIWQRSGMHTVFGSNAELKISAF
jgi:hypothetical protein